jgi:hypothetical protein
METRGCVGVEVSTAMICVRGEKKRPAKDTKKEGMSVELQGLL